MPTDARQAFSGRRGASGSLAIKAGKPCVALRSIEFFKGYEVPCHAASADREVVVRIDGNEADTIAVAQWGKGSANSALHQRDACPVKRVPVGKILSFVSVARPRGSRNNDPCPGAATIGGDGCADVNIGARRVQVTEWRRRQGECVVIGRLRRFCGGFARGNRIGKGICVIGSESAS